MVTARAYATAALIVRSDAVKTFELPYNLTLLPGVRQDHRGKLYQLGRYPSGKSVMVPYEEAGAPPARMIPEPKLEPKPFKAKLTTGLNGERRVVKQGPNRLHVVELRRNGAAKRIKEVAANGSNGLAALLEVGEILRFDGKQWLFAFTPIAFDWHVQYHIDEEKGNGND